MFFNRDEDMSSAFGRTRNRKRGKRDGFKKNKGGGYIKGLLETRTKIENLEYMDMASMEYNEDRERKGRYNIDSANNDRPPPWLKGRQIGMWFRDRQKEKGKQETNQRDKREQCIRLCLDHKKEMSIRQIVDSIGTPLRVPIQTHIPERLNQKRSLSRSRSRSKSPLEGRPSMKEELSDPMSISEKYKHMEDSPFKKLFLRSITGSITANIDNALQMKSRLSREPDLDLELTEDLKEKQQSLQYQEMQKFRQKLPSWTRREELVHMIENNQIIVISGETGCGKTTQVAQFILDNEIEKGVGSACHVVCTQPRRISAISVAERVAAERNETLGAGGGGVGYTIRLESHAPRERGSILFCTTGILIRMLEDDPALTKVSHLILDEIHERDTISDFTITILKDIIPKRPDLRLILMSATLNAEHFSKYYNDCPMINIPGFTFPVKEYYLEDVLEMLRFIPTQCNSGRWKNKGKKFKPKIKKKDREAVMEFNAMIHPYLRELSSTGKYSQYVLDHLYGRESEEISLELIVELIKHIDRKYGEGAILVFLPGWDKISSLNKMLKQAGFSDRTGYVVIPLHSMLSTVAQKTVFDRPTRGMRKIVIATNIAETSITIDDVVFVIDCGKIKMKNFDLNLKIATLNEEWVSIANAKQRKGRAGRVQDGICFHLFTRAREQMLDSYPLPEMLRTRLEEVILQAKMLQLGKIKPFLSKVMNPPDPKTIEISLKLLNDLNALDDDEHLTPLGYHLARLPMDPQTGKMILMGALFSVIDPVFSVAASLSFKDPFVVPLEEEATFFKKKKELALGTKSDHLIMAEVLTRWEVENETNGGWHFTREYFLSSNILSMLRDMKRQFVHHLYDMKFLSSNHVKDRSSNLNCHNIGLVKAVICAGLYPNIAIIKRVKRNKKSGRVVQKIMTPEDGPVYLHKRSINCNESEFESAFLMYHMKMKTTKLYLHDSTMVFALALIFFGHDFELVKEDGHVVIELSPKIRFTCAASTALLVKELRQRLDQLLEYKVAHPGVTNWDERTDEGKLLRAIAELISYEDEKLSRFDVEESDGEDFEDEEDDDMFEDRKGDFANATEYQHSGQQMGGYHRFVKNSPKSWQNNYDQAGPSSSKRYPASSSSSPYPRN